MSFLHADSASRPAHPKRRVFVRPSGHAIQGYLLGMYFGDQYPQSRKVFTQLGEDIAQSRIVAKAHYPSDKSFGKVVAEYLYSIVRK